MIELSSAAENIGSVLADWSMAFLDRLFSMLEAQEEPAKLKDGGGMGMAMALTMHQSMMLRYASALTTNGLAIVVSFGDSVVVW